MSKQEFAMDYIDVATRIVEFRTKFPDGSLQPADLSVPYRIETFGDRTYLVVVAAAYRTPDDPRPGIGMAYEPVPGGTPYTRGSELQNAETSAWGRALVAALAADTKKGIATAEEKRHQRTDPVVQVKNDIWEEANQRGWVAEDHTYSRLSEDFATWSQGEQLETAEQGVLEEYLKHLRPKKTMQRGRE